MKTKIQGKTKTKMIDGEWLYRIQQFRNSSLKLFQKRKTHTEDNNTGLQLGNS
uniref:Uncharacterized protein n=1 Tax=Arion vulgaris TaxID=1028688 RepID=A0A0B6ZHN2_9EUPU